MKTKGIIIFCFLLIITMVLFINPYKMYHHIKAEGTVSKLLADPTVRDAAFGNNSEISSINYLGSNMYRVEIDNDTFVIEINAEGSRKSFQVFEFKQNIDLVGY